MKQTEWLLCPLCGNKTRNKSREDTVLKSKRSIGGTLVDLPIFLDN
ncbi:hypothetical protein GPK75_15485 [[Eubacterium] rectale]|nr:hypothetical protein [Agathobacter rectalis]